MPRYSEPAGAGWRGIRFQRLPKSHSDDHGAVRALLRPPDAGNEKWQCVDGRERPGGSMRPRPKPTSGAPGRTASRRLPPQSGKRHDGSDGLRPRIAHLIALDVLAGVFIRHSIAIFQVGGCAARRKKAGQQKSHTYQEEVLRLGKITYHPCSLFCDMMAYQMTEKLGPGATAPA